MPDNYFLERIKKMTNTNIKDLNTQFNTIVKTLKSNKKAVKENIYCLIDIALKSASMHNNMTQLNKLFLNKDILADNERIFCLSYLRTNGYILSKGVSNTGKDTIKITIKKDCKQISLKSFIAYTPVKKQNNTKKDFDLNKHLNKLIDSDKAGLHSIIEYLKSRYDIESIKQALL